MWYGAMGLRFGRWIVVVLYVFAFHRKASSMVSESIDGPIAHSAWRPHRILRWLTFVRFDGRESPFDLPLRVYTYLYGFTRAGRLTPYRSRGSP